MSFSSSGPVLAVLSLLATLCAAPAGAQGAPAQPGATSATSDPAQAGAPAPAMRYRSALAGYRPWREQAVGDWREANDNVGRIGGWRTYLRQAQEPQAEPAPASAPTRTPAPAPAAAPATAPAPHAHPGSRP